MGKNSTLIPDTVAAIHPKLALIAQDINSLLEDWVKDIEALQTALKENSNKVVALGLPDNWQERAVSLAIAETQENAKTAWSDYCNTTGDHTIPQYNAQTCDEIFRILDRIIGERKAHGDDVDSGPKPLDPQLEHYIESYCPDEFQAVMACQEELGWMNTQISALSICLGPQASGLETKTLHKFAREIIASISDETIERKVNHAPLTSAQYREKLLASYDRYAPAMQALEAKFLERSPTLYLNDIPNQVIDHVTEALVSNYLAATLDKPFKPATTMHDVLSKPVEKGEKPEDLGIDSVGLNAAIKEAETESQAQAPGEKITRITEHRRFRRSHPSPANDSTPGGQDR
jgi:hypothetical protein